MNFFRFAKKHFAIIGLSSSHQFFRVESINVRIIFGFLIFVYPCVSQIIYIDQVADSFIEYVQSVCTTAASIIVCICFASFILRRAIIFELIKNIEELVDTSKTIPNCHF